ncbi:MAG TPA: hypothetical protein VNF29_00415 [Candidatus Binataceae bacterium]|nr:hypothetical protein [Candidatus Binataceae bacterium]
MRKFAIVAASAMLGIALAFSASVPAIAAGKVDCAAVMTALGSGKKAKEIATDMKISTSSVYRCKRKAKAAAKAETKAQGKGKAAKEAVENKAMAPAAAASPAAK